MSQGTANIGVHDLFPHVDGHRFDRGGIIEARGHEYRVDTSEVLHTCRNEGLSIFQGVGAKDPAFRQCPRRRELPSLRLSRASLEPETKQEFRVECGESHGDRVTHRARGAGDDDRLSREFEEDRGLVRADVVIAPPMSRQNWGTRNV